MNPTKPPSLPVRSGLATGTPAGSSLAEILGDAAGVDSPPPAAGEPPPVVHCIPATELQRAIWSVSQRSGTASVACHRAFGLRLQGPLDVPALRRAFASLVARHDALRTTFSPAGDVQRIASDAPAEIGWHDFSNHAPAGAEEFGTSCADEQVNVPFDPVAGPLVRAALIRLDANVHLLTVVAHGLICDDRSLCVMEAELAELYSAATLGRAAQLAEPVSFRALAERPQLSRSSAAVAAGEYWRRQFPDEVPVFELPADHPRGGTCHHSGAQLSRALPSDLVPALQRLGGELECTPATLLLSAFAVLLHRLSGEEQIAIGLAVPAPERQAEPHAVGPFTNILPVAVRITGEQPLPQIAVLIGQRSADAQEHGRFPFATVASQPGSARGGDFSPVPVVFSSTTDAARPNFARLRVERITCAPRIAPCELSFRAALAGAAVYLSCEYSTELYDEATIARWFDHFETLLRGIVANSQSPVADLPILGERERRRLLVEWNETSLAYERGNAVTEMFRQHASRAPDATALVAAHERWTYGELDHRSDAIACFLRQRGIGPGAKVGIFLARSPLLLATMLGVMKAGAAYVPLDVAFPSDRLDFIARDTGMPVVLTQRGLHAQFPRGNWDIVPLDDGSHLAPGGVAPALTPPDAEDLAYVIYTSGSTGRPKGVCVTHGCLAAFIAAARQQYRPEELAGVLFATSASFDVSLFETMVPLCLGGKVIMAPNIVEFGWLPALGEIKLISGVPSAVTELVRNGLVPSSVCTVNVAGEPCPQALVDELYALPHIERVYDMYGPTETTVYSTGTLRRRGGRATIGRPLPNERAYILDRRMQPVPVGVRGELYIGGDKVARGYLNLPEQTRARFLADPFRPGCRMYRTGDAARFLPDGNIEYLGRLDHQVKIRGYRIELGEIESVLATHPAVAECVVVARTDPSGAKLLAYVVAAAGMHLDAAMLRAHLGERVPEYMVPAAFTFLAKMRRTASGKVDRRALPDPDFSSPRELFVAPRSTAEELLADIWRDVLGLEQVGVHDSFFELGGHSLLAVQVIVRLQDALNVDLTIQQLFSAPTIAALANVIEVALLEQINAGPAGSSGSGLGFN